MGRPEKVKTFMYALMKEAYRDSLMEWLEEWEISEEEYKQIEKWFKEQLDIKL